MMYRKFLWSCDHMISLINWTRNVKLKSDSNMLCLFLRSSFCVLHCIRTTSSFQCGSLQVFIYLPILSVYTRKEDSLIWLLYFPTTEEISSHLSVSWRLTSEQYLSCWCDLRNERSSYEFKCSSEQMCSLSSLFIRYCVSLFLTYINGYTLIPELFPVVTNWKC